jgi:hypothetical protein
MTFCENILWLYRKLYRRLYDEYKWPYDPIYTKVW